MSNNNDTSSLVESFDSANLSEEEKKRDDMREKQLAYIPSYQEQIAKQHLNIFTTNRRFALSENITENPIKRKTYCFFFK